MFSSDQRNRDLCQAIVEGHQHIERYLDGVDLAAFRAQQMVQDAVSMRLQQVLECANKLSPELKSELKIDWPSLVAMRNKISHNYDQVDAAVVWTVVRELKEFRKLIDFAKKRV